MGIGACIRSAPQSGHIALVLITDDLGIVARIAHRVAVMYAGEIVEAATADALFRDPRHPCTRGLIGCIPVPGRTRPGETLGVIPDVVPTLISDLVERRACLRVLPAAATVIDFIDPRTGAVDGSACSEWPRAGLNN